MDAQRRYDDIVDALTAWHPDARAATVFGMPCVKRSGRVVLGLSRTGMVFKLTDPAARARALALPGAHLFDPSGRGEHFRCWVVVPPRAAVEWEALAYEALLQDHSLPPPPRDGDRGTRGSPASSLAPRPARLDARRAFRASGSLSGPESAPHG